MAGQTLGQQAHDYPDCPDCCDSCVCLPASPIAKPVAAAADLPHSIAIFDPDLIVEVGVESTVGLADLNSAGLARSFVFGSVCS